MNSPLRYSVSSDVPVIDAAEVLHYLGYARSDIRESDIALVDAHTDDVRSVIKPAAVYNSFEIELSEGGRIKLPWGEIVSHDLSKNLSGCSSIYVFAATLGIEFDRLLARTRLTSMADAAIVQAIGSAFAESFVEMLNDKLKAEAASKGLKTKPRFSPGFGDFSLENQKGLFSVLDPAKHIGLTLKENCIMAPEKSVTAVIGIYE